MKLHEYLFFLRHIAMERGGMEKVYQLCSATLSKPWKIVMWQHPSMWSSPSIFGVLELQLSFRRIRA